jgi:glycosyltransferase involved in cell wall biosynthesis
MTYELSVITVCRDVGISIEPTITSVLAQQNVHIQYIIIDGNSKDDTMEVIARHRHKINMVVSEPDLGIYDAMNKGLAYAKGDFVFFLNAKDRFFAADVAARAVQAARDGKADILFGDVAVTNTSGGVERHDSYRDWDLANFFEGTVCHQGVFAARTAFEVCGRFNLQYKLAADFDWLLIAMRQQRLRTRYLSFPICYYDGTGLSSDCSPATISKLKAELHDILEHRFTRFERLFYKAARRCRLRQNALTWAAVLTLMQWRLRQ